MLEERHEAAGVPIAATCRLWCLAFLDVGWSTQRAMLGFSYSRAATSDDVGGNDTF